MPRDASGNYTLPAGNPVVSGTVITPTWANPTMNDVGVEITDSLSRSGKGGMLVPFRNTDGVEGAPGITWLAETATGLYRSGVNDMRASVGSVDSTRWIAGDLGFEAWDGAVWQKPAYAGVDQIVTGAWNFTAPITLDNGIALQGKDIAGDPQTMLAMSNADVVTFGNAVNEATIQAPNSVTLRVDFGTIGTFVPSAQGGLTLFDFDRSTTRKVGYRNPKRSLVAASRAVTQADEDTIVTVTAGSVSLAMDALEVNTKMRIMFVTGAGNINEGAGAIIQRFTGGTRVDGDIAAPFASIWDFWMTTSSIWYAVQISD